MIEQIMGSQSVSRLKSLIESRYGKKMAVQTMADITSITRNDMTYYQVGTDLKIPITNETRYLATAVIEDGSTMKADDKMSVGHLVKMVLEPLFYDFYLERQRENSTMLNEWALPTMEAINETTGQLIALQATNPNLIPKIGMELHDLKQKWAFLRFSDIAQNVENTADLIGLGDITLLIEDILLLTPAQRQLIIQYSQSVHVGAQPLILIGVTSKISELAKNELIDKQMSALLQANCLDLDRLPTEREKLTASLELFLEPAFEV